MLSPERDTERERERERGKRERERERGWDLYYLLFSDNNRYPPWFSLDNFETGTSVSSN